MRWTYVACWVASGVLAGCGNVETADIDASHDASMQPLETLMHADFGPAFSATIGWGAFKKSTDGGCPDAIAQVNEARAGLENQVQWMSVRGLNAYTETNMAWATFWEAGCSTAGKAPETGGETATGAMIPLPTRCGAYRDNVSQAWAVVVATAPYKSLVAEGVIPTLENAFAAAASAGCVY